MYKAIADETFLEYELDYIVFAKLEPGNFKPNPTEVKATEFVGRRDLDDFLKERESRGENITPWFKLIKESKLPEWWTHLEQKGSFPMEADKIISFM